ncbi:hypothetical protein [Kribbella catacumbae]|uniref:hypothetical protein n=1 Tax=Kribbella catacumbae TaxID=460086 RepID=UPI0012FA6C23|nr:hypothetical protein [Kribbella catacumbae]
MAHAEFAVGGYAEHGSECFSVELAGSAYGSAFELGDVVAVQWHLNAPLAPEPGAYCFG